MKKPRGIRGSPRGDVFCLGLLEITAPGFEFTHPARLDPFPSVGPDWRRWMIHTADHFPQSRFHNRYRDNGDFVPATAPSHRNRLRFHSGRQHTVNPSSYNIAPLP